MIEANEKLIQRLEQLYRDMLAVCWDLSKHSPEGKKHAEELNNAAFVLWQWIEELKR